MINYALVQGNEARDYLLGNGFLNSIEAYLSQFRTQSQLSIQTSRFQSPVTSSLGFTRLNVERVEQR